MHLAQQSGDGGERGVCLAPSGIRRQRDVTLDEDKALSSVVVDADREWGADESGPMQRTEEGVNRRCVRGRRAKNMLTDADDHAGVGDATGQGLLNHTATLADEGVVADGPGRAIVENPLVHGDADR
ncbi:MAG: hypothetical protein ACRDZ2_03310 [Ilumatobacteraceae bacterium]